mmetsp:Transcript_19276/g.58135  ORF Transcript_19276/g.58135 Transcript_19276/m.58135 type:complete len:238 (-) Transcript_19276:1464-2177(-)
MAKLSQASCARCSLYRSRPTSFRLSHRRRWILLRKSRASERCTTRLCDRESQTLATRCCARQIFSTSRVLRSRPRAARRSRHLTIRFMGWLVASWAPSSLRSTPSSGSTIATSIVSWRSTSSWRSTPNESSGALRSASTALLLAAFLTGHTGATCPSPTTPTATHTMRPIASSASLALEFDTTSSRRLSHRKFVSRLGSRASRWTCSRLRILASCTSSCPMARRAICGLRRPATGKP